METTQIEVTPELRLKRLNMLLEANEKCPDERFSMNHFGRRVSCGTIYCLAGNYVAEFPNEGLRFEWCDEDDLALIVESGDESKDPDQADLGSHFGISHYEVFTLFYAVGRNREKSLEAVRELIAKYQPEGSAS